MNFQNCALLLSMPPRRVRKCGSDCSSVATIVRDTTLNEDAYLARVLLAFGISCTYHVPGYNRVAVVIALAVAALSAYDANSDFLQGVRGF